MTAATVKAPLAPLRLARAELLKLRKRKGVWIPAAFLTVGAIVIVYLILELGHLSNPGRYGPAGGTEHFRHALFLIAQLSGLIAAVMVGTHAGTQDVSAGVFRELVATGRPRTHLFFARVPGGLGLLLPLVGLAYALTAVLTVAFAGGGPTPSVGLFVEAGLWAELAAGVMFCLALGLSSLIGSRAASSTLLLAWLLVIQPLITSIRSFGDGREAMLSSALERIAPISVDDDSSRLPMSVAAAVVVIVLWAVVPLAAGWFRTQRRDA